MCIYLLRCDRRSFEMCTLPWLACWLLTVCCDVKRYQEGLFPLSLSSHYFNFVLCTNFREDNVVFSIRNFFASLDYYPGWSDGKKIIHIYPPSWLFCKDLPKSGSDTNLKQAQTLTPLQSQSLTLLIHLKIIFFCKLNPYTFPYP